MKDVVKVTHISNFINNAFLSTSNTLESFNPSNGKLVAIVPDSEKKHGDMAVEAAHQAFKLWSVSTINERVRLLNKVADDVEAHLEEFAMAESADQGKPYLLALNVEIPRAIHNLRFFASAIQSFKNESTESTKGKILNFTTRTPNGVAVLISPWNLPLYLLTWKIAPCIASGCTCVCKPSEYTSVTAYLFCQSLVRSGMPPGVVNIVFGLGSKIGNELVIHPDITMVSFTGGTVTGAKIKRNTLEQTKKKVALELGGKNPAIVFADADIDKLIPDIGRACFQNSGQICLCSSRIFVHVDIMDKFINALVKYARSLKLGDALDVNTQMGPVASKEHQEKIKHYISLAVTNEHKIVCGETVDKLPSDCDPNGYYILPTVITNLDDSSPLMKDEIFGPVVCVTGFHEEDEVIERANNTNYGLAATVWTRDLGVAHRVSRALQCGTVWVNCFLVRDLNMPFGGVKDSGCGSEGFPYSLDFFSEQKTTCIYYG